MNKSWIYEYELKDKQQSTVLIFQADFKSNKSSSRKKHGHLFFGINEHVTILPLVNCRKVNSETCTIICLPELLEEIRKINQRRRIILHHDNGSCRTQITQYLIDLNIETINQPPCSPDMAHNDFFFFP